MGRILASLAVFATLAAAPAFAGEQLVVNRCGAQGAAVWLASIERGGECAGCLAQVNTTTKGARYLVRVPLGQRAAMRVPERTLGRLYTYPVGHYARGVESSGQAPLEIVANEAGQCVVRTAGSALALK